MRIYIVYTLTEHNKHKTHKSLLISIFILTLRNVPENRMAAGGGGVRGAQI